MTRNKTLMELSSGEHLLIEASQLGTLFCPETFVFVLDPCTRRAAERIARWHGCRFEFHETTGCASFVKRGKISGTVTAFLETAIRTSERSAAARLRDRAGTEGMAAA